MGKSCIHIAVYRDLACQQARSRYTGKLFVSYERGVTFHIISIRVITGADYDVRSSEVLNKLGWETLARRRELNKLVLMYKVLGNHTAPNLKDLFSRRNASQNIYDLRNSETDLSLKKPKTEFLKKTFGYSGAILWNSLPQDVKAAESITSFKTMAKLHLSK